MKNTRLPNTRLLATPSSLASNGNFLLQAQPASGTPSKEQGLTPIMLAIMAGTLPGVIAKFGGVSLNNESAISRLIETADGLLLAQVRELGRIPTTQRRRYWQCLLEAMIEDKAVLAPAPQKKS